MLDAAIEAGLNDDSPAGRGMALSAALRRSAWLPLAFDVAPGADGNWVALVEAAHSDALLAAVLAAGASVREVGPA